MAQHPLQDLYMAGVKKQTIPIPPYGPQLTFALISGIMFAMVSAIRNVLFSFRNYLFFLGIWRFFESNMHFF